jgi:hypothetical protein
MTSEIKIVLSCPLGHTCEKIVEDRIERCNWYTHVCGYNPNTGKQEDQWGCAISWIPILQVDTSYHTRQTSATIESFRNEVVKANDKHRLLIEKRFKLIGETLDGETLEGDDNGNLS